MLAKVVDAVGTITITDIGSGKSYVVGKDHINYSKIRNVQNSKDLRGLLNIEEHLNAKVTKHSNNDVECKNGGIFYKGERLDLGIVTRTLELMRQGFDITPMIRFISNLMDNPSHASITELYAFLEHKHLPITEDGYFLAYKVVNDNYTDKHTSTVDNTPGKTVNMPRNMVDDNRNNGCSRGYHVGTLDYCGVNGGFYSNGDRILLVKVNPREAVSVPLDSNQTKLRVCEYFVLKDVTDEVLQDVKVENDRVYSTVGEEIDPYDPDDDDSINEW